MTDQLFIVVAVFEVNFEYGQSIEDKAALNIFRGSLINIMSINRPMLSGSA
jgi:hypothetical protein